MKDANISIRTSYYNALNNTLQGRNESGVSVNIPFYDQIPSSSSFPYIYVSDFTMSDDNSKDRFSQICTITLVVVSFFTANTGGQYQNDLIVSQVLELVRGQKTTQNPLSFLPDFYNIVTKVSQSNSLRSESPDGITFSRTIKFIHKIQQTSNN